MLKRRKVRRLALVAHDSCKPRLAQWCLNHQKILEKMELCATGTTGSVLHRALGRHVDCLASGPLGGDQQIGTRIVEGKVDALIFFWDPLAAQPHDPDVKALLRLATVWNIPTACNLATADMLILSPLIEQGYQADLEMVHDYKEKRQK